MGVLLPELSEESLEAVPDAEEDLDDEECDEDEDEEESIVIARESERLLFLVDLRCSSSKSCDLSHRSLLTVVDIFCFCRSDWYDSSSLDKSGTSAPILFKTCSLFGGRLFPSGFGSSNFLWGLSLVSSP